MSVAKPLHCEEKGLLIFLIPGCSDGCLKVCFAQLLGVWVRCCWLERFSLPVVKLLVPV